MKPVIVALIREGKNPPDKRVALTPNQCITLMQQYPQLTIVVQRSPIRAIPDSAYADVGMEVLEDISHADIMIGIKEVNIEDLISNKTYLFFSHTFKKQPYNRNLLRAILDKNIRLIDYEVLKYPQGGRIIGFGRYAGIVGAYNGLLAYGRKIDGYTLKPAHQCTDRKEVELELEKVELHPDFKMVLTGVGRVGRGAREIIDKLDIQEVDHQDFISVEYDHPVFTHIDVQHYYQHNEGKPFERRHFFANPGEYHSVFPSYIHQAHLFMACHYWASPSPYLFTREDAIDPRVKLRVVGDVSCDIDGPVPTTIRPSSIVSPMYGYNPHTASEADFMDPAAIGVMAVDNLPCELPKDASEDFGSELSEGVFPHLLGSDDEKVIWKATQTQFDGTLTPHFAYLQDYVDGKELV